MPMPTRGVGGYCIEGRGDAIAMTVRLGWVGVQKGCNFFYIVLTCCVVGFLSSPVAIMPSSLEHLIGHKGQVWCT